MDSGRFVPWMAYSPPDRVSARCTHRIAWSATRDDVRQTRIVALDLRRWCPGRLDVGTIDDRTPLPLPSGSAHPNGISDRHLAIEDKVQAAFPCVDHDGAPPGPPKGWRGRSGDHAEGPTGGFHLFQALVQLSRTPAPQQRALERGHRCSASRVRPLDKG